jgi:hypothetical protein
VLDFPQHTADHPPLSVALDLVAFQVMTCRGSKDEYPASDMCWGIVATQGAFSTFHIDSDGLGTYVSCVSKNGSKWWVIVGPRDRRNVSDFASMEKVYQFHAGDGIDATALGDVQVEVVLLRPGTRLCVLSLLYSEMHSPIRRYMKPNTAHAVLTTHAAICHGGHYITTSNLRSTCYGYLIGFSMSMLLTNTNHTSECQLLFRNMLSYYFDVYT